MKRFVVSIISSCFLVSIVALPTSFSVEKSVRASAIAGASATANSDGPITFDSGNVGVNAGGFHAAAGLGGLITGDASKGGLHAETGGAGTGAAAGLGGGAGAGASAGASAYASAGAAAGAGIHEAETSYGHKTIRHQVQVVAEKTITEQPKVVNEKTVQGAAQVQRTVIEKTVIPQYVEKTIQVPSYVEKTIRVPTVVEHKVRVPVTPKVVEKTYEENGHASSGVHAHKHVSFGAHAGASAGANAGRVSLEERPPARVYKDFSFNSGYGGGAYGGGAQNYGAATAGTSSSGAANAGSSFQAHGYAYKSGGGLLGNILSIPVATLGAVGNLLHGIGQGGGSISVNKHYQTAF